MASQTSFKQQCPSCEAMVPIKDSSLVGKKVDCPKCKYRFVVEDPGDLDEAPKSEGGPKSSKIRKAGDGKGEKKKKAKSSAEGDDKAEAKGKKKPEKKGSSKMLILGIGLGVVAVIGLVVGAIVLFGGDGEKKTTGGSTGSGSSTANKGTGTGGSTGNSKDPNPNPNPMPNAGGTDGDKKAPAAPDASLVTASNLLPNDTQVVYSVNMPKFMDSALGGAAFRSASGYQQTMFDGIGLPLSGMNRFLRGENLKNKWVFNVVQMFPSHGLKVETLKAKLGDQKGTKSPIKGNEYYMMGPNETIDGLSALNFTSLLTPNAAPPTIDKTPLAWHLYNATTLVIAEVNQMELFLEGGRQPAFRTHMNDGSTDPMGNPPGAGGPPMGGAPNMPMGPGGGRPQPGGFGAGQGGPPMGGGPMGPGGGRPQPGGFGAGQGGAGGGPVTGPPGAGGPPAGPGGGVFTDKSTYLTIHPDLKRTLDKMEEAQDPVIFSCAGRELETVSTKIIDTIRSATMLGAFIPTPTIVAAGMGIHKLSSEKAAGVAAVELKSEADARALDENITRNIIARAAAMLSKWLGTTIAHQGGTNAGGGGGGAAPPGFGGGGGVGPPGFGGGGGAGPPMGGFGGGGGGPPMPGGFGGGGGPPGAGPPGVGVPNPGGPGGFGGGGAGPNETAQGPKSFLRNWFSGKVVFVTFEAEINPEADNKIRQEIEQQVVRMKGSNDVAAMTGPRWLELADTAKAIAQQKLTLRGTHPLAGDNSGAVFVTRPPNQRVGWMVDLLPYLGKADIAKQVDIKKGWRDEPNVHAGTNWVPQFLNPFYPRSSWQASVPSMPGYQFGATHYTALGGIGLDAAELAETDATRKRLGLFGYDRPTNFNDIPDGASNTIYLITTPPNVPRPWIAGGGATVQGVPESGSLAPFVADFGNGKKGAYVLMADGSVRFLKSDTPDDVFKALVTKAGADSFGVLDAVAPKINAPAEAPKKPAPSAPPAPAPSAPPKKDDAKKEEPKKDDTKKDDAKKDGDKK